MSCRSLFDVRLPIGISRQNMLDIRHSRAIAYTIAQTRCTPRYTAGAIRPLRVTRSTHPSRSWLALVPHSLAFTTLNRNQKGNSAPPQAVPNNASHSTHLSPLSSWISTALAVSKPSRGHLTQLRTQHACHAWMFSRTSNLARDIRHDSSDLLGLEFPRT